MTYQRIAAWLLGALLAIVSSAAVWFGSNTWAHAPRITALESHDKSHEFRHQSHGEIHGEVRDRLGRIETKLDRLIESRSK